MICILGRLGQFNVFCGLYSGHKIDFKSWCQAHFYLSGI